MQAVLQLLLWLVLAAPFAHAATPPGSTDVDWAEASLEPDGLPMQVRQVALPFRWDHEFPGRGGKASYRIVLPRTPPARTTPRRS